MPASDRPRRDPKKPFKARTPEPPPKATGSWSASKIFSKSSAIINADVQTFLLTCITGWNNYSLEEQHAIIDTLPKSRQFHIVDSGTGKLGCPLDAQFVTSDPYLKRAVKRFQSDVDNGYYTQTWQRQSRQALKDRADGRFNEYMKQHVEETFGNGHDTSREQSTVDAENRPPEHQGYPDDDSSGEEGDSAAKKKRHNPRDGPIMQVNDSYIPRHSRSSRSRTTSPGPISG